MLECKFEIKENRLVKKSNGEAIPDDEPVFVLRARDVLAIALLASYYDLSMEQGCNSYHMDMLRRTTEAFVQFASDHPERMKQPSVTRGI